jgi:uncharacterized SAM-binding protein YcdF (DUF218 family)
MATCISLFFCGKYRTGKVLLLVVFLFYYLLSINPVASFLSLSLMDENAVNGSDISLEKADAIVVLSGGVLKKNGYRSFHELSGISWKRLWHGIEVFKELEGQIPILYVGGTGKTFKSASVESELAKVYAVEIGVPDERFWTGPKSRNTYESGIEIKQILDTHLLRSKMVMEKVGLDVVPSPADFVSGGISFKFSSFIPTISNFSVSYFAVHEWIGIAGYKLLGRI